MSGSAHKRVWTGDPQGGVCAEQPLPLHSPVVVTESGAGPAPRHPAKSAHPQGEPVRSKGPTTPVNQRPTLGL